MEAEVYKNDTDSSQYYNTNREELVSKKSMSIMDFDTFEALKGMNIIIEVRPGESLKKVTDDNGKITGYKRCSLKFN